MTTGRGDTRTDPMQAGAQVWEAGYQALLDGQRQAQAFWNSMARGWGEAAGAWMGQAGGTGQGAAALPGMSGEGMQAIRELQEAAFGVAQAWMRLPLALAGGGEPNELQGAMTALAEAQGRAFQLWTDALARAGDLATGATRADSSEGR